MSQAARRRFHLSDAIVLVVAAALMLSADRAVTKLWNTNIATFGAIPIFGPWQSRLMTGTLALALFNVAMLCSTLSRRLDRSRLRSGAPGLYVHAAVVTTILACIASWTSKSLGTRLMARPGFFQWPWQGNVLYALQGEFQQNAAIAILAGWLTLVIVGRWNPGRAWDDRLGRFSGLLWLLLYFGGPLLTQLP